MNHPPRHDDPLDAHLVAALRHAPDRDVAPPAQITAAILGHAQQAVRDGRRTWLDDLRAVFASLWQPAPMAAFGTLALATLIGVMWGGQELPEATPSLGPASKAAAPAPDAPRAASATVTAPVPVPVPPAAAERSAPQRQPAARAEPKPAQTAQARKGVPGQAALEREAADAATAGTIAAPVAAAPPAIAPPASPPPAAAAARELAPQVPEVRRDAFAKSMADAAAAAPAPAPPPSLARAPARARSELTAPALGAAMSATVSPLAQASTEIDAAMASDPARVRWRIAAQRFAAHDTVQRDWWSALARATEGHWRRAATATAEDTRLVLLIDRVQRGSLAFEPQALVWRDVNGVTWRAPLPAETLRNLQEPLARW